MRYIVPMKAVVIGKLVCVFSARLKYDSTIAIRLCYLILYEA